MWTTVTALIELIRDSIKKFVPEAEEKKERLRIKAEQGYKEWLIKSDEEAAKRNSEEAPK